MDGIKRHVENAIFPDAKKLRWLEWGHASQGPKGEDDALAFSEQGASVPEVPQVMTSMRHMRSMMSTDYRSAVIEGMDMHAADAEEDFMAFLVREEEEAARDLYERHLDRSVICPVCRIGGLSLESRKGGFFLGCTNCDTNVPLIDPTLTIEEVKDGLAEVISSHARGKCSAFPTFEVHESVLFLRCDPCGYCEVAI
eukprot:GEMP01061703.1.p1 GENE.GEMP01061703.1~~GEMP01061703.1.p1  ORF type:complete len:197 (+),score=35.87 GEMP01061703.1:116-706(+)